MVYYKILNLYYLVRTESVLPGTGGVLQNTESVLPGTDGVLQNTESSPCVRICFQQTLFSVVESVELSTTNPVFNCSRLLQKSGDSSQ